MSRPIWQWSACEVAATIRAGEISCVEAVESVVTRVRETHAEINAVVDEFGDEALVKAGEADSVLKSDGAVGPLHGVPVTIKENTDQQGKSTTNGVAAFKDLLAPGDAPVTRHLKEAGAIVVGRTSTPEFNGRFCTDSPLHGLTINPWDSSRTCGGSSGGAAAAVAMGCGPIAHGTDLGGSLRHPAYCCGVTTVRPTLGRVAAYNPSATDERPPLIQMMTAHGAIAREVRDVRLGTRIMAQRDVRDPGWMPVPFEGPRTDSRIRVAVTTNPLGFPIHPAVEKAVLDAARILEEAGYRVEAVDPPFVKEAGLLWRDMICAEFRMFMDSAIEQYGGQDLRQIMAGYYASSDELSYSGYARGLMERYKLLREWCIFLENYPLVLTPLTLQPPFRARQDTEGDAVVADILDANIYMSSMNLLGLPASVISTGLHEGVPVGVQIIGQRFREDMCLDAAEAIEREVGVMAFKLWERGVGN